MKKCVLSLICFLLLASSNTFSQSITLTSPMATVEFPDGDEFSFTVAGSPWNMEQLRDIPFDWNFQQPVVKDGIWTGTNMTPGAMFYPLFRGYSLTTYTNYPNYYTGGMPYGPLNPIDCATYDQISFRMGMPKAQRTMIWMSWTTNINIPENFNNAALAFVDGDYLWSGDFEKYADGFRIYDIGFTFDSFFREKINALSIQPLFTQKGSWTGTNYGFFIQPSSDGAAGTEFNVDWVRLYNSSASPKLNVRWTTIDIPENDTNPHNQNYSIQLWVDNTNSGYAGDLFQTGLLNDGSYQLNTAALPPGDYYIYLKAVKRGNLSYETLATSGYSGRIRILSAPLFEFTAPSYTSGVDYATSVLGDPWNMSGENNFDMTQSRNFSNPVFSNGFFSAYADPPLPGDFESDVQLMLNTKLNGQYVPIDARRFRYLTYRMAVDQAGYTNIHDRVARGWVTRFIWGNSTVTIDGSETQPIPILEDWRSYTLDLWDRDLLETKDSIASQTGWKESGSIKWFRFDPLEVPQYTLFHIDEIMLCAENTPVSNNYTISWMTTNSDSDNLTITLSRGTSQGAHFTGTHIATVTNASGKGSYVWKTGSVPPGSYYIKAVISDGANSVSRISKAPVVVGSQAGVAAQLASGKSVVSDYTGDGKADVAVYKEAGGLWVIRQSGDGSISGIQFGASGYAPIHADYDGDGKTDIAVYHEPSGWWYVLLSGSGYSSASLKFGEPGYLPIPADYDGDGKADLAVYHEPSGWWYVLLSGSGYNLASLKFGEPGYIPVPADYDGDGKADLAVYHEPSGWWYVLLSGSGYNLASLKFGEPGYIPVPADYDGDGKTDIAVYHESSGWWYMLLSGSGYEFKSFKLGDSGYVPAPADYDGDGAADLAVYRSATGEWYATSLDGRVLVWID